MLLSPTEAFKGWGKLFLGRWNDGLIGQRNEVLLAFDSRVKRGANAPHSGAVVGVGTGGDQESVHRPVMIRAEGEAVIGFVIPALTKGDDVGGLHERQIVRDSHADPAGRTAVVINLKNGMAESTVAAWRFVVQGGLRLVSGFFTDDGRELFAFLREVACDESFP